MLELVPLNRDHVVDVYPRRRGEALEFGLPETMALVGNACANGIAYAAIDGDKVIAVGGVFLSHENVGSAWILGTDEIKEYSKDFTKILKESIPIIFEEMRLNRLQADVIMSQPNWIRWAKYLGFKEEGILRRYRGDQDSMALSIIKEDLE